MFVTIKYGADEERIVNPNCLSAVFLSHIRKTCGFDALPEHLDLATENGEVIDLVNKPKEYAKKHLEPRTTYILVKVVGDDSEDANPTYIPLLDSAAEKLKFSNPFQRRARKGNFTTSGKPAEEMTAKSKVPNGKEGPTGPVSALPQDGKKQKKK